jgi:hypothetical protein
VQLADSATNTSAGNAAINVGGAVWAMDWAPTRQFMSKAPSQVILFCIKLIGSGTLTVLRHEFLFGQFLAIAALNNEKPLTPYGKHSRDSNCIQIWNMGPLGSNTNAEYVCNSMQLVCIVKCMICWFIQDRDSEIERRSFYSFKVRE